MLEVQLNEEYAYVNDKEVVGCPLQMSLNLRFSAISSSAPHTGIEKKNNVFLRMHLTAESKP